MFKYNQKIEKAKIPKDKSKQKGIVQETEEKIEKEKEIQKEQIQDIKSTLESSKIVTILDKMVQEEKEKSFQQQEKELMKRLYKKMNLAKKGEEVDDMDYYVMHGLKEPQLKMIRKKKSRIAYEHEHQVDYRNPFAQGNFINSPHSSDIEPPPNMQIHMGLNDEEEEEEVEEEELVSDSISDDYS